MTLSQVRLKIGAVLAFLGLSAFNLDSLLVPIVNALGLPPAVLNMPGPVKVALIVVAAVYALAVAKKASLHNPDGTPAEQNYIPPRPIL